MKDLFKKYYIYKWVGADLRIKSCTKEEAVETANRLRKMINLVDAVRK